mgnify:CR=1 FL=1
MLESYIPILMMMVGAVAFAIINIIVSKILGPKKPNAEKLSTYESGMEPVGNARDKFSVKYYMVSVLFILFDIEVVFLYPWAVSFVNFEPAKMVYSFISVIVFVVILFIGYFYVIKKGALKWD